MPQTDGSSIPDFPTLWRDHIVRVVRKLTLSLLKNPPVADEITQLMGLLLWFHLDKGKLPPPSSAEAIGEIQRWTCRVARNLCLSNIRRKGREEKALQVAEYASKPFQQDAASQVEALHEVDRLRPILSKIEPDVLEHLFGESSEAADDRIRARVYRLRKRLREALGR